MISNRLKFFTVTLIFLIIGSVFSGCTRLPERPVHEIDILDRMADLRCENDEYGLLISKSGLTACIECDGSNREIKQIELPVEGLYFSSMRLIEGWTWIPEKDQTGKNDSPGDIIRPDRIERIISGSLRELITVDPDNAICLLEIPNLVDSGIDLELRFDFRPLSLAYLDYRFEYDDKENILIAGDPLYGFIAVTSNGFWIQSERKSRKDYPAGYYPLEDVASIRIPGLIHFEEGSEPVVAISAAGSRKKAVEQAISGLKNYREIKDRASQNVLDVLNRAPLVCEDKELEAVAAWDRWLLVNHLSRTPEKVHFLPSPPVINEQDVVVDARAIPAWFWATAGDTTVETILDSFLIYNGQYLDDPEGTIFALNSWIEWLDKTGRSSALHNRLNILVKPFNTLGLYAKQNSKQISLDGSNRWDIQLRNAGLIPSVSTKEPGLTYLYSELLKNALSWDRLDIDWRNLYANTSSRSLVNGIRTKMPYKKIIKNDRFVWGEKEREAWEAAKLNPDFNLGFADYLVFSDRENPTYYHLGRIARRLWGIHDRNGLRWSDNKLYEDVRFITPEWLIRTFEIRERGSLVDNDFDAYRLLEYPDWISAVSGDSMVYFHGSSPESTVNIAERTRFLYEVLLGINLVPESGNLQVTPLGPVDLWKDKRITSEILLRGERITLTMDPYNGFYQVVRREGDQELNMEIVDVPISGESLSVNTNLKTRGVTDIQRGIDRDGNPTLLIDGRETINVSWRKI